MQVGQRGLDLLDGLAHAEDEVALGHQTELSCRAQYVEAALVAEGGPDSLEDARNGFDVVRQHFWPRLEHLAQQIRLAVEVGNQQFDTSRRVERLDGAHGLGVEPGAAVGQVVAGHTGDRRVLQPHRGHALGDPARLVAVQFGGLTGVDLAEVAPAGALLAADQERRFAVFPAFVDVGAAGFLADGVQALPADQTLQRGELRTHPGAGLDPRRLAFDGGLGVANLETQ